MRVPQQNRGLGWGGVGCGVMPGMSAAGPCRAASTSLHTCMQQPLLPCHRIAPARSLPAGTPVPALAAVLAGEVGGGNGIEPLVVGSRLGVPVVDGDLMGRAFPELQVVALIALFYLPTGIYPPGSTCPPGCSSSLLGRLARGGCRSCFVRGGTS